MSWNNSIFNLFCQSNEQVERASGYSEQKFGSFWHISVSLKS